MKTQKYVNKNSEAAECVLGAEDIVKYPSGPHLQIFKLVEVCRKATIANTVIPERVIELLSCVNFCIRSGLLESGEAILKGLSGSDQPGNIGACWAWRCCSINCAPSSWMRRSQP